MKKNLFIGLLLGIGLGLVFTYLFGPADEAAYDETYRSRWDKALEDGDRAADEKEKAMHDQLKGLTEA
ncbi:MAG: hypothetical protein AAF639_38105 [Chloroflexota bacterium]